jgi:hypothetical protein
VIKKGCFGVLAIGAIAVAGFMILAWAQVAGEELASAELQQVPVAAGSAVEAGQTYRVLLDIKDADLVISAAPEGSEFRVEATFDPRYFDLEQNPKEDDGQGPMWHVWFRRVRGSGSAMTFAHRLLGATQPEIRVHLPRGVQIALNLNTAAGKTEAELSGLDIQKVYGEISGGVLNVGIQEQTHPMESFEIDSRQARIVVRGLGNASPQRVEFDIKMGYADIDLHGAWIRDAEVELESMLAGGLVRVPKNVKVVGLDGEVSTVSAEVPLPTLTMSAGSGGLIVQR